LIIFGRDIQRVVVSAAWTQPPASPPNCPSGQPGCDTPVHVGSTTQAKSGALGVGGVFQTNSSTYLAAVNGNVGIGTTSPTHKLDVNAGGAKVKTYGEGLEITTNTTGGWARSLRFRNENWMMRLLRLVQLCTVQPISPRDLISGLMLRDIKHRVFLFLMPAVWE
jgi:hypothetical protein